MPEDERDRQREKLVRWRLQELLSAGYDLDAAKRLADRFDVDLRRACLIRSQGCSNELALEILL